MPWIRLTQPEQATGLLHQIYSAAMKRVGRVWNILRIMSPNPPVLKASMDFYAALMHGPSPLTRTQREMLATVVSARNKCRY
jgi:alkylhydroperoxidase family enzyme